MWKGWEGSRVFVSVSVGCMTDDVSNSMNLAFCVLSGGVKVVYFINVELSNLVTFVAD